MGALVGTDPSRPVLLDAHAREEAEPLEPAALGGGVALLERPQRGLALAHHDALLPPEPERLGGVLIGVAAVRARQVDLHHVEGAARAQDGPLLVVDHVVRRGDHRLERADRGGVVAQGLERLHLGHCGPTLTGTTIRPAVAVTRAACPHDCPDTCAMLVTVEDGRATRVKGNPDQPVIAGFLCGKVSNYLDRVYHGDRLLHALIRDGGGFGRASWDEALDLAAARLRKVWTSS